jgi:hypothetical protein
MCDFAPIGKESIDFGSMVYVILTWVAPHTQTAPI